MTKNELTKRIRAIQDILEMTREQFRAWYTGGIDISQLDTLEAARAGIAAARLEMLIEDMGKEPEGE